MFRPLRLILLALLAFLAGALTERYNASEKCDAKGGRMDAGLCRGLS